MPVKPIQANAIVTDCWLTTQDPFSFFALVTEPKISARHSVAQNKILYFPSSLAAKHSHRTKFQPVRASTGWEHQRTLIHWESTFLLFSFPLVLACNSDIITGDPAAILHHEETLNWKPWTWIREQSLVFGGCHASHRLPTP